MAVGPGYKRRVRSRSGLDSRDSSTAFFFPLNFRLLITVQCPSGQRSSIIFAVRRFLFSSSGCCNTKTLDLMSSGVCGIFRHQQTLTGRLLGMAALDWSDRGTGGLTNLHLGHSCRLQEGTMVEMWDKSLWSCGESMSRGCMCRRLTQHLLLATRDTVCHAATVVHIIVRSS